MNIKPSLQIVTTVILFVLVVFNLVIYLDLRESVALLEENHKLEYQLATEQETTLQELSTALQENHTREYELALEQGGDISRIADAVTAVSLIQVLDAAAFDDSIGETFTTESGLKYEVLASGSGQAARNGDTAVVHYTGWLLDGAKFDSSVDRGEPFEFVVGQGGVIKGWDEAVAMMKVGDKWKLTIPPDLAYKERGVGGGLIPPNSTLVFDVELLDLK